MSGLGDLSSFVENKQPIVDLSWLNITPGVDYDNIPTDNVAEKIPELVQAWSHLNDRSNQFIPNQMAQRAVGDAQVTVTPQMVEDVVLVAKKAMMLGMKDAELTGHLRERFPVQQLKAASGELKKVASERGLLGGVYVDLSCFDTCKQASTILGKNRIRLATFAVGKPKREPNFVDGLGNAREIGKRVVASVEYTPELLATYERHLKTAGVLGASDKLSSREDLQKALLAPRSKKSHSELRSSAATGVADLSPQQVKERLASIGEQDRTASAEEHFMRARKVLSFMQDQMLEGKMGDALKEVFTRKYASETVAGFASEIRKVASLQGLQGQLYVDVSLYDNHTKAIEAIRNASTAPMFLVQSFKKSAHDNTLELVASATGLSELPRDGKIDPKIASSLIERLQASDKISAKMAGILREKLSNKAPVLSVVREANLATLSHKKEVRSASFFGTEHVSSAPAQRFNRDEVVAAAKIAFNKGFPFGQVESKVASAVPAVEAHGLVRDVLSSLDEVSASTLTKCATERYPLKKGAKIASADKCSTCVHRSCGFCLRQAAAFVGEGLNADMVVRGKGAKLASSTINDEFGMGSLASLQVDFSKVVEPPKVSGFDTGVGFGSGGMDSFLQ